MKNVKKISAMLVVLLLMISCGKQGENDTAEKYMPESFGRSNLVTVVMDADQWKGKVGDSLRKIFQAPVDGLPMEEPLFSLTYINPQVFDGMLEKCRSIIMVKSSDKKAFHIKKNVYAKPQKIVYVSGSDDDIISQLAANSKKTIATLKNIELKARQTSISRALSFDTTLEETFGIHMNIPSLYKMVKKEDNFVWYERDSPKGTMNVIAYTLPYGSIPTGEKTLESIMNMRDSIGKAYVPGRDPKTMHMITEREYEPYLYKATVDNKPALETKGIWEVKNFQMAGPFINYIVDDKAHNRLVVVEGFTFAPSEEKRDFMFELEAILKSLKIKK